ncbi:CaiB/BaiF CoA transferase family protein [Labrys monachus]|uniref:Crotonobetainyl-CoA:carnitine CoA-transferase CaiB-like acyl-CoA transferase n=1 Tax=Labrys monachus TaxID=217067 RepID=A0ABU0FEP9_9HYPH|nr:CaiB/BaiF CoA-transferase family protein [Labrys monachus]MDQ0393085.1 crotonobetainyl-CoA:carnitine CoA-transferase CaiB-like acyl-CoA transferase [Labrys monachus]
MSQAERNKAQILSGYRVLDCTVAMAGPFAAQRMGDLGADVVKIEPVEGEWQRRMAAGGGDGRKINASFLSLNRNKRSVAINLKSAEGQAVLHRMVEDADVFMQNYRPHVAKRLAVDYDTLKAINPKLIYVSVSGYGTDGPYAARPGQDLLLQALSGAMYSTGVAGGPPQPSGQYVVDATTAYAAFEGALAALLHRERTGEGQLVEVNMLDAAIAFQMQELSVFTIDGKPQERTAEPHANVYIRAPYGVYETQDGYVALAFPPLAKLGELFDEPLFSSMNDEVDCFEKRDLIHRLVMQHSRKRKSAELIEAMLALGLWAGPVNDFARTVEDPQVKFNGSFVEYEHHTEGRLKTPGFPIRFSKTPSTVDRGAPLVGEHSREVLGAAGFGEEEIARMISEGVIGAP